MINSFINLYNLINTIISISRNKAFKDKNLIIIDKEVLYLKNTLLILKVFIKAINKL